MSATSCATAGQSFELPVDEERDGERRAARPRRELRAAFADAHEARYGYRDEQRGGRAGQPPRLGVGPGAEPSSRAGPAGAGRAGAAERRSSSAGGRVAARMLRGEPAPGTALDGPALCALPESTLLVPPGWSAQVDEQGTIVAAESRAR